MMEGDGTVRSDGEREILIIRKTYSKCIENLCEVVYGVTDSPSLSDDTTRIWLTRMKELD